MKNPTLVFPGPQQLAIEDREMPTPGADELLIQTRRTLISTGTELTVYSGDFESGSYWSQFASYPFVPGYCNVGTVVDTGLDVDRESWLGLRVATYGTHSQFITCAVNQTRRIHRSEVSDEDAVFFTIAEIVMNGIRRSRLVFGESVAVYGLGLLGQLTVRICRLSGAKPVLGIDIDASLRTWQMRQG